MSLRVGPAPTATAVGAFLLAASMTPAALPAETSRSLSLGYSWSDNLEVQPGNTLDPASDDLSRQGIELGLSLLRQTLGADGGHGIAASVSYNRGFDSAERDDDIIDAALVATRLLALNRVWLARLSVGARHHDSGPLPLTSYNGLSAEATLGYLGDAASGVDLGLGIRGERHAEVEDDRYDILRGSVSLRYYLPHGHGAAIPAVSLSLSDNAADVDSRSYRSVNIGASLRQWRLGPVTLEGGAGWQEDRYASPVATAPAPGSATPGNGTPPESGRPGEGGNMAGMRNRPTTTPMSADDGNGERRRDRTGYFWLGLGHRIRSGFWLRGEVSGGRYRSSIGDASESYYRFSLTLSRDF